MMPLRRGACPGLSVPMPTGDGLLVRLMPLGTVSLAAFAKLCAAARMHGNGIIEITGRGSIQVRGLNALSAPQFAAAIATLGIADDDGIPVSCSPLHGLDTGELIDTTALAGELRAALARTAMAAKVGAKVSVAIDGGGPLGLDELTADIRLSAEAGKDGTEFHVAVGGDASAASSLGTVSPNNAIVTAIKLLDVLARRGREARARDIVAAEGVTPFSVAIGDLLQSHSPPCKKPAAYKDPIGLHPLRDGIFACGIGLAFGHADAETLEAMIEAAKRAKANGLRVAPRALLVVGFTQDTAAVFVEDVERLGFIVRADDPRRRVFACAGAPVCTSAHIPARTLAPLAAAAIASHCERALTIHISGCAKGCAHPAPAALTVVGTPEGCALVANGTARDSAFAIVSTHDLPAAIAKYVREAAHG
jgi:precorrin-3B synthase